MYRDLIEFCLKIVKPIVIMEKVLLMCFGVYGVTTYMEHNYWSIMLSVLFVYMTYKGIKKVINTTPKDAEEALTKKYEESEKDKL